MTATTCDGERHYTGESDVPDGPCDCPKLPASPGRPPSPDEPRTTLLSPLCDACGRRITSGRIVVTGGDDGDLYLHEECVQP